ncbi:hypothetical protein V8C42DRAFT_338621 [Trichoderma barbatum]
MASLPGPLPYQKPTIPPAALGPGTPKSARKLTPLPLPTEGNEIALAYSPRKRKAHFDPSLPQLPKMPPKASHNEGMPSSFWSGLQEAATAKPPTTKLTPTTTETNGNTPKKTRIQKQIDHIRRIQDTRFETIIVFSTVINECLNGTQGKYNIAAATQIHKALETTLFELIQHDKINKGNSENPERLGTENGRPTGNNQQHQRLARTEHTRPTPAGGTAPNSDPKQDKVSDITRAQRARGATETPTKTTTRPETRQTLHNSQHIVIPARSP